MSEPTKEQSAEEVLRLVSDASELAVLLWLILTLCKANKDADFNQSARPIIELFARNRGLKLAEALSLFSEILAELIKRPSAYFVLFPRGMEADGGRKFTYDCDEDGVREALEIGLVMYPFNQPPSPTTPNGPKE